MVRIFSAALGAVGVALALTSFVAPAQAQGKGALDQITFGTDWQAEAEHGGYYQALAAGIYEKYGLKVTLRQGGPQVNHAHPSFSPPAASISTKRRRLSRR